MKGLWKYAIFWTISAVCAGNAWVQKVYAARYASQTRGNEGNWYFVKYAY